MVIRAGVDDRHMVSALGVNIQRTFAIVVRRRLRPRRARRRDAGPRQATSSPGTDSQWLLNSLVVVIIGGMGSLGGAAVGALLFGVTGTFAPSYLPTELEQLTRSSSRSSLLAVVLAVRPYGLFGRPA